MALKRRIERLKEWACDKAEQNCYYCEYSIYDGYSYRCPFYEVIQATEDREKEVQPCEK